VTQEARDPVEVIRQCYPKLVALAKSLGAGHEAEDLAQETLFRVLSAYPGFRLLDSPLGYSKVVLVRLTHSRPRMTNQVPYDPELATQFALEEGEGRSLDNFVRKLDGLGSKQRACIYLRYGLDMSDASIARIVGCSEATVRSQINRGLKRLQDQGVAR